MTLWLCNRSHLNFLIFEENFIPFLSVILKYKLIINIKINLMFVSRNSFICNSSKKEKFTFLRVCIRLDHSRNELFDQLLRPKNLAESWQLCPVMNKAGGEYGWLYLLVMSTPIHHEPPLYTALHCILGIHYIHTCSRNDCIPLVYSVPCNIGQIKRGYLEVIGVHCTEMKITKNKNS